MKNYRYDSGYDGSEGDSNNFERVLQQAARIHQGDTAKYYGVMMVRQLMEGLEVRDGTLRAMRLPEVRYPLWYVQGVIGCLVRGVPEGVKIEFDDLQKEMWGKLLRRGMWPERI